MEIKSTKNFGSNRLTALILGPSGSGKTTLAKTLNGKTLIISLESGLLSLSGHEIDYVELKPNQPDAFTELAKFISNPTNIERYDNLYFDSLTEISACCLNEAKIKFPDPTQTFPRFGEYNERMTKFIRFVRDLEKNVFFTSLVKVDRDDSGYRKHLPDISGSIATKINGFLDFVFHIRLVQENEEQNRLLQTRADSNFDCKDRSGKLSVYEPMDLSLIYNKVFK
jgi:phage nucleotide-binding protein